MVSRNRIYLIIIVGLLCIPVIYYGVNYGTARYDQASEKNALKEDRQKSISECEVGGGQWKGFCDYPAVDAGKVCSDSSECQKLCIAERQTEFNNYATTGICSEWTSEWSIPESNVRCTVENAKVKCLVIEF